VRALAVAWALVCASALAEEAPMLRPLTSLCVTLGALTPKNGGHVVDSPKVRAVATVQTAPVAELRFRYLGPTVETAALRSGAMRRQIGVKLRAADSCNLLYVMWRLEPEAKLVVSLKRNPGQHLHAECGTRGYQNLVPRRSAPLPAVAVGARHVLRAALVGGELTVLVDGAPAWSGTVPPETAEIDGPVGLRTDNGRFELELWAPAGPAATGRCWRGEGD
jgi:hypothetical protein